MNYGCHIPKAIKIITIGILIRINISNGLERIMQGLNLS